MQVSAVTYLRTASHTSFIFLTSIMIQIDKIRMSQDKLLENKQKKELQKLQIEEVSLSTLSDHEHTYQKFAK